MTGPYVDPYTRPGDLDAARQLVDRLGKLHADRMAMAAAGDHRAAVRDSILIHDQVDSATLPQLRAAVILLSTPELRPAVPVVVGPGGVPVEPDPTPPAPWVDRVIGLVKLYGNVRAEVGGMHGDLHPVAHHALEDVRAALSDGALAAMLAELEQTYRQSPGFRGDEL